MKYNITNRYGLKIVSEVLLIEQPKGLVFLQHGLGGNRKRLQMQKLLEIFQQEGFSVCTFDATHATGESEGDLLHACLSHHAHDLADVIAWAKTQSWFQTPFGLVGHSLGAGSAILYTAENTSDVSFLMPLSSVVSGNFFREYCRYDISDWESRGYVEKSNNDNNDINKLGFNYVKDLDKYDLLNAAPSITCPTLLVVGENDTGTPPRTQKALYDALTCDKELHIIDSAEHSFKTDEEFSELKQIIKTFLKEKSSS